MGYDSEVFRRASRRLEQDVRAHEQAQQEQRARICRRVPRIAEIEQQMRRCSIALCKSTFDRSVSPLALDERMTALRRERAELLVEHGYDAFALENDPLCPLCGGTGWRAEGMCSCLKRYCVDEQIKELSNTMSLGDQSFSRFRLDYYASEPHPAMRTSPRENMEKIYAECREYAERFGRYPVKNMLFTGSTGLGKTFLSACIAREVSERGNSVVYDTALSILRRFEEEKFRGDDEARDETRRYFGCDLLIIDDLGSEAVNQFSVTFWYQLINTRLVERKNTIISTNLSPAEIRKRYTPQIYSRLLGEYKVQPFFGEDIRLMTARG